MIRSVLTTALLASLATLALASDAVLPGKVQGELTDDDALHSERDAPMDVYEVETDLRQLMTVRMTPVGESFDTYLYLMGPSGQSFSNDDAEDGSGSLLQVVTAEDGFWEVVACGYNKDTRGKYELEVKLSDLKKVESRRGELTEDDLVSYKNGERVDVIELPVKAGRTYVVQMISSAVNSYLSVYFDGTLESNDDSPSMGDNAQVIFTAQNDGTAKMVFTTSEAGQLGKYTAKILEVVE